MEEKFLGHRGVSGSVIAIAVVVIIAVVGIGAYFALGIGGGNSSNTSHTTTSSTASSPPAGSLNSSVITFLADLNGRNVDGMKTYYVSSSQIVWSGNTGGTGGTYTGPDGAGIVYGTTVGHTTSFKATQSNTKFTSNSATDSTVAYHLAISGVSTVVGAFNASANVSQEWSYQNGQWIVVQDNWNYLSFTSSNPSEATVFPQWGLTLNGKSPTLAGEHVLEWNVAPYLAATIYALIAALGVALLWVRFRGQKR